MTAAKIVSVAVDKIDPDPNQPRKSFPPDYIAQLARSIAKRGQIQPITLRPQKGGRFMLVAGECRWRAHVHNKAKIIKAIVEKMDAGEANLRAIVENVQRRDMNPIEEANAYRTLIDRGYSMEQIVEELSLKSTSIVRQRMDLLDLTPDVQALVATGNLSVIMAWGIALAPARRQGEIIQQINTGRLRTADQVKAIGMAMRDAEHQMFPTGMHAPPSRIDLRKVGRLETTIEYVAAMVSKGFKDGACVAAQRVAPDRVAMMADKLTLIRKHILQMEHELRRASVQVDMMKGIGS